MTGAARSGPDWIVVSRATEDDHVGTVRASGRSVFGDFDHHRGRCRAVEPRHAVTAGQAITSRLVEPLEQFGPVPGRVPGATEPRGPDRCLDGRHSLADESAHHLHQEVDRPIVRQQ